eukprot:jgi/Mesen1/5526/ME000279S04741
MGRLEDVCLALGISIAVGRFLVCFLLSIPAGFIHRFIGPVTLRHAWATISGLILSYYAFGATANYLLAIPVLMAYGSMLADRKHCGLLTTVSTFIYLIACHVWYMSGDAWKGGGIDFTGSLMILTLKVTSCAMNYQDGLLPPERLKDSQRAVRLTRLPSLLEFFGYILNCGTHFAGPVYEMSDYLAWSERTGRFFNSHGFKRMRPSPAPSDVYERLTPKGKKPGFWQLLATQVTSAIWHGLYPGYAMYFVGTAIFIAGSKVIYGYQKAIPSDAVALRRICTVLHWFYAQLVNNYSAIGFL